MRKNLLFFFVLLICSVLIYNFGSPSPGKISKTMVPPALPGDDFLIGGLHDAADDEFTYLASPMNFNLWHSYVFSEDVNGLKLPRGWYSNGAPDDNLLAPRIDYIGDVQGVITEAANNTMKVLLQRPKIEYLCYGQRSDYQCEPKELNHCRWFYSFNDHPTGVLYVEPSGDSAMFCTPGNTTNSGSWVHNPGFLNAVVGVLTNDKTSVTHQLKIFFPNIS